jgi:hypothetical protein
MTTALSPSPKQQFFTASGVPLVGGKLYTYAGGTSTPLATYQDSTGTVSNTNPVILDSRGEANVWLSPSDAYKFVLRDSADVLIWTVDNINIGINFGNVIITGGSINGAVIGNISPAAGTFTDLTATGTVTFNAVTQMQIPAGLTSERTTTPVNGMMRFNTTANQYEGNISVAGQTISTLVNTGSPATTAVVTTSSPHGLSTGDYITVSGCVPTNYNGSYNITYISTTSFSYVMAGSPGGSASTIGTYLVHQWAQIGGGATGAGNDQIFVQNGQTVTATYAIPVGKNASSVGPITINSGVSVTIPSASRWVIL